MSDRIEEYAIIGDCETVALVNRSGSIDWLCWPHFASPACFAALVGTEENGHWSIAPRAAAEGTRRYLDHTLILETTFETLSSISCRSAAVILTSYELFGACGVASR